MLHSIEIGGVEVAALCLFERDAEGFAVELLACVPIADDRTKPSNEQNLEVAELRHSTHLCARRQASGQI